MLAAGGLVLANESCHRAQGTDLRPRRNLVPGIVCV